MEKTLRRMSRAELLELLLEQQKKYTALEAVADEYRAKLDAFDLTALEAGSIAEASLRLNDVFAAAQQAADQYLENVKRKDYSQQTPLWNARNIIERARDALRQNAQQEAEILLSDAEALLTEAILQNKSQNE